jgi:hypothetical protein
MEHFDAKQIQMGTAKHLAMYGHAGFALLRQRVLHRF